MPTLIQLDILFLHSTLVMYLFQVEKLFVLAMILDEICCLTTAWEIIRRCKILARGRKGRKKRMLLKIVLHIPEFLGACF